MPHTPKRVYISVVSDLSTDQRVHRTAFSLSRKGLDVTLAGRRMNNSLPLKERQYKTKRFKLLFEKGPFFYLHFNVRLFFYLLFRKTDILVANDLDTLAANFLISRLKRIPLYYDSHEYFTGVPELVNRPNVQALWKKMERFILPRLKHMYTVNESIASMYSQEYGIKVSVIRNLPITPEKETTPLTKKEAGLPENKKILLFQGAGINIHRGAEEMLEAMLYLEDYILVFIGGGDVVEKLKSETLTLNLNDRVFFFPKMPMEELRRFTMMADIGLSLDKDSNVNYRYSLPNKLFDYIHAGIPVLVSDLPELRKVVDQFDVGSYISSHDPAKIAEAVKSAFSDKERFARWKENLKFAASQLCWEKEESRLYEIYKEIL